MVMMNAMLGAATSLASGFGGKDMGAPTGDGVPSFGELYNADVGSLTGSSGFDLTGGMDINPFGGSGTFSSFDMNVNSMPDFGAGSFMDYPIYDISF